MNIKHFGLNWDANLKCDPVSCPKLLNLRGKCHVNSTRCARDDWNITRQFLCTQVCGSLHAGNEACKQGSHPDFNSQGRHHPTKSPK